jgi:NADPH:quinone reductase-like Zn-dependent oxidoreductase
MEVIPATVCLTVLDGGQIQVNGQAFRQFTRDIEDGSIKLTISRAFPLDKIADAHRFMKSKSSVEKSVVFSEH